MSTLPSYFAHPAEKCAHFKHFHYGSKRFEKIVPFCRNNETGKLLRASLRDQELVEKEYGYYLNNENCPSCFWAFIYNLCRNVPDRYVSNIVNGKEMEEKEAAIDAHLQKLKTKLMKT